MSKHRLRYITSVFDKKSFEHENLNGIRAISILSVVIYHVWVTVKQIVHSEYEFVNLCLGALSSGVDFFFLLSGFLIYGGLRREFDKNGKINIKDFFVKRSLRIFPAYYFALFVLYSFKRIQLSKFDIHSIQDPAAIAMFESIRVGLSNVWVDALYLTDILRVPVVYDGGWSLSIEEHFYMVLPFFCVLFFFRIPLIPRLAVYLLGFSVALFNRYSISYPIANLDAVYQLYCRFDSILFGMLVYEMYHLFPWETLHLRFKLFWSALLLVLSFSLILWMHQIDSSSAFAIVFRPTIVSVGFGILMYFSFFIKPIKRFFSWSFFRPFARLGYTAYLWHIIVIPVVATKVTPIVLKNQNMLSAVYAFIYVIFFTFLTSWVVYLIIELPFLRMKEKLVHPIKIQ
ncbi:acyltransferase [Leptospira levettii]|uniref:Acyltransferase n=1 Tax=Leptospira levettii TaxID=2023178 RepID=A0ABY2MNN8_9LEPT|nr:acyltransferase [Leptospira levettii]MCW7509228.1 acyltransferase [Leptospira levettii]MCW7520317.1 acyltransferase [Leptospira levettii]TGL70892.1 acyltransferase [Leptospira levettii]TGM27956.1 acyltransferase [Leptospira levettii]TGM78904.1 acyltransferase [Leptospira levettii]